MTKKLFIIKENGVNVKKYYTFDEILELFQGSIKKESWSMVKRYSFLNIDETEQQFLIETWNAFETYDITKEQCFSTHLYWRFKLASKVLLDANIGSRKAKDKKEKETSLNTKIGSEDSAVDFSNQTFEFDSSFNQMDNLSADKLLMGEDMISTLIVHLTEEEKDMLLVLIDDEYSVAMYAQKWGISRMGANKRRTKLKEKLAKLLKENYEF